MNTKEFRSFLTFQSLTATRDAQGGAALQPNTVCQVWGKLESASGNEKWVAEQLRTEVDFKITTRDNDLIKSDMQVVLRDGRLMKVLDVVRSDLIPRFMIVACRSIRERTENDATQEAV